MAFLHPPPFLQRECLARVCVCLISPLSPGVGGRLPCRDRSLLGATHPAVSPVPAPGCGTEGGRGEGKVKVRRGLVAASCSAAGPFSHRGMQRPPGRTGSHGDRPPPPPPPGQAERSQLRKRRKRQRRSKSESDLEDVDPLPGAVSAGASLALGRAWPAPPSTKEGSARDCLLLMDTGAIDSEPGLGAGGEAEQLLGAGRGTGGTLKTWRQATRGFCSHLWFWRRVTGIFTAIVVIILLLWFTLRVPTLPHLEPCADDWLYYRKKCYYLSEGQADWDSSQSFCSARGASLAVIENQQEMNFIMNRMRTRDSWIGLRKKGDKFYWMNGEILNMSLFPVHTSLHGECAHTDSISISISECRIFRNWLCSVDQLQSGTFSP